MPGGEFPWRVEPHRKGCVKKTPDGNLRDSCVTAEMTVQTGGQTDRQKKRNTAPENRGSL